VVMGASPMTAESEKEKMRALYRSSNGFKTRLCCSASFFQVSSTWG
jgi:hypothetical protein